MSPPRQRLPSSPRTSLLVATTVGLLFFVGSWNTRERLLIGLAFPLVVYVVLLLNRTASLRLRPGHFYLTGLLLLVYDVIKPRLVFYGAELYGVRWHSLLALIAWALLAVLLARFNLRALQRDTLILVGSIVLGGLVILNTAHMPLDVWAAHDQAGRALVEGNNPYADLSIEPSFEADEDSSEITSYPYTPPNLFGFGLASALTGDSRWFSLACWVGFLLLISHASPRSAGRDAVMWLMASQPAWPLTLEMSYTEPLSLLLMAAAVVAWKRRPALGLAALGVFLASKQYLVVVAPLLLIPRLLSWRQRTGVALAVMVAAGLGLIWGFDHYYEGIVAYHSRVPPQAPSANLYGIGAALGIPVSIPSPVGIVAGLGATVWFARRVTTPPDLILGAMLGLSVAFFLASQAFVNYWLLVACMMCVYLVVSQTPELGPSSSDEHGYESLDHPSPDRISS